MTPGELDERIAALNLRRNILSLQIEMHNLYPLNAGSPRHRVTNARAEIRRRARRKADYEGVVAELKSLKSLRNAAGGV